MIMWDAFTETARKPGKSRPFPLFYKLSFVVEQHVSIVRGHYQVHVLYGKYYIYPMQIMVLFSSIVIAEDKN